MTSRFLLVLALACTAVTTACANTADRGPAVPAHTAPFPAQLVSVSLEDESGTPLPTFFHQGSTFVAGQQGQAYAIRLANTTGERVEVVVTVDGRDVISGQLGNFKKQRGYVLEPFGSIRVEGFRQSFQHVASFRFSGLQDSYTARQGTPQHAGVIGIAVFREKASKKKTGPIAVGPAPFPAGSPDATASAPAEPFPSESGAGASAPRDRSAAEPAKSASAPPAADDAFAGESEEAAPATAAGGDGGFAPPPQPRNELGTEYGETRVSSVHEVKFKRNKKRKPDELFSLFYDSPRGLQARGVPIDAGGAFVIAAEPEPFPGSR